jgi:tetratricopeptide (TPR) repeat protein
MLDLAEAAADLGSADRDRNTVRLKESAADVVASVLHYLGSDPVASLRLIAALPMFWQDLGRVDEGRRLTEKAIDAWTEPPAPTYARALVAAAELAVRQGAQAAAERHCHRSIEAAEVSGDPTAAALAHVNLARIAYRAGDGQRIEKHAQRALEVGGDDIAARRGGLHMLAWAAHTQGDHRLAKERFEASLSLRRSIGDRFGEAVETANLADLAAEQRDFSEAARRLRDAMIVGREIGSTYLVLNLLPSLAAVAAGIGDDEACARLMGATDALSRLSGLVPDPGAWQPAVEHVARRLGDDFEMIRALGRELDEEAAIDLGLRVANTVSPE